MKKLKSMCMVLLFAVLVAAGVVDAPMVKAGGGRSGPRLELGLNETCALVDDWDSVESASSSNSEVVTISDDGIVKGVGYGETVITVKSKVEDGFILEWSQPVLVSKPLGIAKGTVKYQPGFYEYAYRIHKPLNAGSFFYVRCLREGATYTYSTTSNLLKMEPDGTIKKISGTGVAEIILTEHYNNQEEQVGAYKLIIQKIKVKANYKDDWDELNSPVMVHRPDVAKIEIWEPDGDLEEIVWGKYISVLSDEKISNQKEFDRKINPVIPKAGKDQSKNILKYSYDKEGKWDGDFITNKPGTTYIVSAYYNYKTGKYVFASCEKYTVRKG